MQIIHESIPRTRYQSEAMPHIETTDPRLAEAMDWADTHPHVWDIVTRKKSKAFGLGSSVYLGCAQWRQDPNSVLDRLRHFYALVTPPPGKSQAETIFTWRARFTFERYRDRGFTGGFFQQHDACYPRSCLWLDYTPDTFELVLDRFRKWMDPYYSTVRITLDGKTVWTAPAHEQHR